MALASRAASLLRQARGLARPAITAARRGFADQAEEGDIVKETFIKQQKTFRILLEEARKAKFTIDPDNEENVEEYQAAMRSVRQAAGVPSITEKITALIDDAAESTKEIRSFMEEAKKLREKLGLEEDAHGMEASMFDALDRVEEKLGKPLTSDNEKGLEELRLEFDDINAELGLHPSMIEDYDEETEYAVAKAEMEALRDEALSKIEMAKRDGLENVSVDLKSVDPRPFL